MTKQSPTVLSYATPGSKKPNGLPPPPFYRRSIFWTIVRRVVFAFGMGLLGLGIGGVMQGMQASYVVGDAQVSVGWGMTLIGLCIPLGPLPWFMREDGSPGSNR